MAETFRCTLVTPERQVLDEDVIYASVPAWDGLVGIMQHRAPLLVKLGDGALRVDTAAGQSKWFLMAGGFGQMKDNKLTLLTQSATPAEEISQADAQAALKEAEARRAISEEEVARKQRDQARARAMINIKGFLSKS